MEERFSTIADSSLQENTVLPDFPDAKARTQRLFLRQVEQQVPELSPLLKGIAKFRQHEGRKSEITRLDDSKSTTDYRRSEFSFTMSREEYKQPNPAVLIDRLVVLAKKIGEDRTKRMLEVAGEAAEEVGNVVNSDGELTQEKFLDIFRKIAMDFDPKTLKVDEGFFWVMHPDTAAKVVPKVQQWENDPKFNAEYEHIMATKREEWRDREANRRLVD